MNNCDFIGRVTKDIELKQTPEGKSFCRFTLACDRGYKTSEGKKPVDFIPCVSWGSMAETISKYVSKGNRFSVSGELRTGSYEGNHGKVYTYEVYVHSFDFLEPKKEKLPEMQDVFDPDLPF